MLRLLYFISFLMHLYLLYAYFLILVINVIYVLAEPFTFTTARLHVRVHAHTNSAGKYSLRSTYSSLYQAASLLFIHTVYIILHCVAFEQTTVHLHILGKTVQLWLRGRHVILHLTLISFISCTSNRRVICS